MFDKKLGFGMMRLPRIDGVFENVDTEKVCEMADRFLEAGFRYFDTAWFYHAGSSEKAVKTCLADRHPREEFLLADKMPLALVKEAADLDKFFDTQIERCGVEYFDYYLAHDMGGAQIPIAEKVQAFDFLRKKKQEGKIRKLGFSFHDTADVLDKLLTEYPDVDFVQLQINYLDWESEAVQSRLCYETAVKHGKPVIVMEPVKGGALADVPEEAEALLKAVDSDRSPASWALKFAAGLDNVMLVLSGMTTMEQLEENMKTLDDFAPLTGKEQEILEDVAEIINEGVAIPCTGCAYCINDCPADIPVPKYFSLYNADQLEKRMLSWTAPEIVYDHLSAQHGKAGDCTGCGECERMCPQKLQIRELLAEVADHFEKE